MYGYQSEDTSKATVDSSGFVTFVPPAGEEVGASAIDCAILVTATEGAVSQTFEVPITGYCTKQLSYNPDTINGTVNSDDTPTLANNVGQYILVLYNAGSTGGDVNDVTSSTALKEYYQTYRPGMEYASYLPIYGVPDTGYNLPASGVDASAQTGPDCCEPFLQQVADWVQTHPDNTIRYVVGLCGLPSRSWSDTPLYVPGSTTPNTDTDSYSVPFMISEILRTDQTKPFDPYTYEGGTDRFSVAEYGAPLVAWLDCGSYQATTAYIHKEIVAAAAGGIQSGITISGSKANVGGTTWVLDDTGTDGWFDNDVPMLTNDGVSSGSIDLQPNQYGPVVSTVNNITAYCSWGVHSGQLDWNTNGLANAWPVNGQVKFTGNSGWWIGMSVESFNGMYGSSMGNPEEFFAANAFGSDIGTVPAYANTPLCFVGSTYEPEITGIEGAAYFDRWAKGWSTLESAWAGRQTPYFLAVTDVCLEP